jgi:hypothetical protein
MISLWRLPPSGGKPTDLAERLRRRVIRNSDANSDRLAAKDARRRFFLSRMKRVARDGTRVASLMLLNRSGCAVMKSLDGLPYCIVGGQATRYYMPERSTIDTDYIIAPESFDLAILRLEADGFATDGRALLFPDSRLGLKGQRFRRESIVVDLMTSSQDLLREATAEPPRPLGAQEPVVALPFLVLMKLDASQSVDQGDLTRMLGLADEKTLTATRDVVRRYLPSDLDDLGQYITIGKLEMGDVFGGGPGLDEVREEH